MTKAPSIALSSLTAKAGLALWKSLSPKTKKQIITSGLSIITQAAARKVMKKTGVVLLIGAIVAGAVYMVNTQQEDY